MAARSRAARAVRVRVHGSRHALGRPACASRNFAGRDRGCGARDGRTRARGLERGIVAAIRSSPYLTRFPASLDPVIYPDTRRFAEPARSAQAPLPDWWAGDSRPLVYVTFGSVTGSMSMAAEVYNTALEAVRSLDVRVLLTLGNAFAALKSRTGPAQCSSRSLGLTTRRVPRGSPGCQPWGLGHQPRGAVGAPRPSRRTAVRGPVRERASPSRGGRRSLFGGDDRRRRQTRKAGISRRATPRGRHLERARRPHLRRLRGTHRRGDQRPGIGATRPRQRL